MWRRLIIIYLLFVLYMNALLIVALSIVKHPLHSCHHLVRKGQDVSGESKEGEPVDIFDLPGV